MSEKRILIVDDEKEILNMLSLNLRIHGYKVFEANNGQSALEIAKKEIPDLILLDIMMPNMDGIEVCSILKHQVSTRAIPVIMVSAKDQISDKIDGLSAGAVDYLTKPFNLKELLMRVETTIKQVEIVSSTSPIYSVGNLVLDINTFQVRVDNKKLDLTLTEFKILQLLMSRNTIVEKDELVNFLFENSSVGSKRVLDVHIRNLRKKLIDSENCTCSIETIRGIGYVCKEKA
jgi:two-component system alkaline phosphatase synthesis response regulator PhoP